MVRIYTKIAALIIMAAATAHADGEWKSFGKFKAGDERRIEINQKISKLAISCVDGAISVQTIVVKSEGKDLPYALHAKLNRDESQQLNVGSGVACSTVTVATEGRGTYEVRAKE